jgi:hypothetical protein
MEFSSKVTLTSNGVFVNESLDAGTAICFWNEAAGKSQEELNATGREPGVKYFMVFEDSYIPAIDARTGKVCVQLL